SVRLLADRGRPRGAGESPTALAGGLDAHGLAVAAVNRIGRDLLGRLAGTTARQHLADDEDRADHGEADVGPPALRLALPHGRLLCVPKRAYCPAMRLLETILGTTLGTTPGNYSWKLFLETMQLPGQRQGSERLGK